MRPAGIAATAGQDAVEPTTAERLLRVAAALFREKGYAATTTRELSDRLHIQKASLYHHIRGKEDLLLVICQESLSRITAAVTEAATRATPANRLHDMVVAHVRSALADRDLHTTMLTDLRSLSADRRRDVLARRDAYEQLFTQAIRTEQAAGRIRDDVDARGLTLSLLNLLNWTIFWFDPSGARSAGDIAEMLATIYFDGARAR
ncbi:MAG TPA: TetR/AcrR family transcriptional regulator [Pseudonocardiaceae bacterium]|nr:TetR/AcrR family transcriptional regulator [Pseudonocardiaceae bacterium]